MLPKLTLNYLDRMIKRMMRGVSAPVKQQGQSFKSLILLEKNGAPDGIRTHGPQIRNLMLYPAELRMHAAPALLCAARAVNSSLRAESRERAVARH